MKNNHSPTYAYIKEKENRRKLCATHAKISTVLLKNPITARSRGGKLNPTH